jgi:hypothetical protein
MMNLSRVGEVLSVTAGVIVGQPQRLKISRLMSLLARNYVPFQPNFASMASGPQRLEIGFANYLSGTAKGEITASATSFMVIRRSIAAR